MKVDKVAYKDVMVRRFKSGSLHIRVRPGLWIGLGPIGAVRLERKLKESK